MMSQQIGDLISREDTLTAFADYVGSGMSMDDYDALWDIVVKMPPKDRSVQDFVDKCRECGKQRTGHWIIHPKGGIFTHLICDKCLSSAPCDCRTNYCPNCGAKMEAPWGESEGEE